MCVYAQKYGKAYFFSAFIVCTPDNFHLILSLCDPTILVVHNTSYLYQLVSKTKNDYVKGHDDAKKENALFLHSLHVLPSFKLHD